MEQFQSAVEMSLNPFSAKASLAIGVNAQGSQQLVVLLMVAALGSFGVTAYFMWFLHPMYYIPLVGGALLVWAAFRCHAKSQPVLDRAAAGPTKVTSDGKGVKIETNALTLADPDASATLVRIVTNVAHRQSLPAPDGTVIQGLAVDTSTKAVEVARLRVAETNQEATKLHREILQTLGGVTPGEPIVQPPVLQPVEFPPEGTNTAV